MDAEVERLEAVVRSRPQDADAADELQAALLRRGQARCWEQPLRDAIADFDAAVRLDPDNPACYQFLGSALTLMGDLDAGGRYFNEMARRQDLIAWHLAGRTTDDMADYLAGVVRKGRPDPFLRWFGDTAQVLVRQAWGRVREADDPDGWGVLAEGVKQRLAAGGWEATAGRRSLVCRWSGPGGPPVAPDMLHAAEHDAMPGMG
jgi:tetratricopeptide (TPR) repeat protein